jgi:uncharacterized protein YbgA (DUF1722 family)
MKKNKYYVNAYNNPSQYDLNSLVSKLENTENEKDIRFYSNIITALRHAETDKKNNNYKHIIK